MHDDIQSRPDSGRIAVVSAASPSLMGGHREPQLFCSLRGWTGGTVGALFTQAIARFGATAVRFRWRALGMLPSVVTMSDIEETKRRVAELESEIEQRKIEFEQLREAMVATVAVERVLLEYGVEPEDVDSIVDDIEAVDNRLGSDDNE